MFSEISVSHSVHGGRETLEADALPWRQTLLQEGKWDQTGSDIIHTSLERPWDQTGSDNIDTPKY